MDNTLNYTYIFHIPISFHFANIFIWVFFAVKLYWSAIICKENQPLQWQTQSLKWGHLKFVLIFKVFHCRSWFLCHSDLLQQISREVAQLASGADLQVATFLISFLHHNLKHRETQNKPTGQYQYYLEIQKTPADWAMNHLHVLILRVQQLLLLVSA